MVQPITYKYTQKEYNLMYKTPSNKGWAFVYNSKGRPSRAYTKLIKSGCKIHAGISRRFVFNDISKRWNSSKSVLDQRRKSPTLKGGFSNKHAFNIENGRLGFQRHTHLQFLPFMVKGYIQHQKNFNLNDPFSLTLQSSTVPGAKITLNWTNYWAFKNWWVAIMNNNREGGSDGAEAFRDFVDAFERRHQRNPFLVLKDVSAGIKMGGGCHRQRGKAPRLRFTRQGAVYDYHLFNPLSRRNNCGLEVLRHTDDVDFGDLSDLQLRKEFGLKSNAPIPTRTLRDIYRAYTTTNKKLHFVDYNWDGTYNSKCMVYVLFDNGHYMLIENMTRLGKQAAKIRELEENLEDIRDESIRATIQKEIKKLRLTANRMMLNCKRGLLTYDFETRNNHKAEAKRRVGLFDDGAINYGEVLDDVICCVTYRPLKRKTLRNKTFISNKKKSSARQFLDFLKEEHINGRHYNCLAHNGSNFDGYLVLKEFTEREMLNNPPPHFRNLSILGMYYYGCVFRDTACYLTGSLSKLCTDFKIDKECRKLSKFVLDDGTELEGYEICFYKPQLDVEDFLKLQHKEPDFWAQYVKYCIHDTLALIVLWEKFMHAYHDIITELADHDEKYARRLLSKCALLQSPTISSVNQKILEELNSYEWKGPVQELKKFYKTRGGMDHDKYSFLLKFKRGGVSHTHQPGLHKYPIMGIDICSQYPWALVNMIVPSGKSFWTDKYHENYYGFYHVRDMKFGDRTEDLKPVCGIVAKGKGSLEWRTGNHIDECYIDSEMLRYLEEHYDLLGFNVVKGLVSREYIDGRKVFGEYIGRLFKAKQKQDILKEMKNDEYNPSLRKATKDSINSLSGKLLADPSKYFSLKYCANSEDESQRLNGVNYRKEKNEMKMNYWLTCGLMMYGFSKMLLFDYIRCLPDKSDSVIQIETDGIYAPFRDFAEFRQNLLANDGKFAESMKLNGKELGNLVLEHISDDEAIFLGKKKYCFHCEIDQKYIMRMLGVPAQTYNDEGTKFDLVTPQVYKNVFAGIDQRMEYMSIRKTMENMPELVGFKQKRTIYANSMLYKVYE